MHLHTMHVLTAQACPPWLQRQNNLLACMGVSLSPSDLSCHLCFHRALCMCREAADARAVRDHAAEHGREQLRAGTLCGWNDACCGGVLQVRLVVARRHQCPVMSSLIPSALLFFFLLSVPSKHCVGQALPHHETYE